MRRRLMLLNTAAHGVEAHATGLRTMNLTIEYQFTFEEYKEASEALAAAYRKEKGKRFQLNYPFKIGRGIFGWFLFIALAIMLFLLLNQRGGAARPAARPAPAARPMDVILPIIPW